MSKSDTNGLVPAGTYTFKDDGKMDTSSLGLVDLSVQAFPNEDGSLETTVNWYWNAADSNYYLFLPCAADRSDLVVHLTAAADMPVMCSDTELIDNEATDVFQDDRVTLTCNGNDYDVVVLQGSSSAIYMNTESGGLDRVYQSKSYKESGEVLIVDKDGTVQYDGELDYIKGRGNSTWESAKKPFNIKLGKKADLFGMGASKKWTLLANAADSSLVRNPLAFDMSQSLGMVNLTSDTVLVDFYANGVYQGVYLLTEKVEIGENRVNIYDLEGATEKVNSNELDTYAQIGQSLRGANTYKYVDIPNDPASITGGYLLELEKIYRYPDEVSGFITSREQAVVIKSPEYASKAQVEYIREYYQQMEDALYSPSGYNTLGKYYTEYLDIDSIAIMYIVEEFLVNFDGCSSSFFLYKDVDGKICAGPAWDFDICMAESADLNTLINNTTKKGDPHSLYIQNCYINYDNVNHNAFLAQLFSHNDFQMKVQDIWNSQFADVYANELINVDFWSSDALDTAVMNAVKWNTFGTVDQSSIINTFYAKADFIKRFMNERYAFLNNAYAYDTFFVKYDVGEIGAKLIHDTTIYNANDTAVVKGGPKSLDSEKTFLYWTTAPDGSGIQYKSGDKITVTGNVNLYAQWK